MKILDTRHWKEEATLGQPLFQRVNTHADAQISRSWSNRRSTSVSRSVAALFLLAATLPKLGAGTPPQIQNVQVTNITETDADITWSTDIAASSEAIFMIPGDSNMPYLRVPDDHTYAVAHHVTLSTLQPGTQYYVYAVSRNDTGDAASTITTPVSFTTLPAPTTGDIDYRLDVSGPRNVYAGSDIYVTMIGVRLAGPVDHLYFNSITGLPSNITPHPICHAWTPVQDETQDCLFDGSRYYSWLGNDITHSEPIVVRLRTQTNTPPGPYNVTITAQSGASGAIRTVNYSFNVLAAPAAVVKGSVAPIPPIPGLQNWESTMVQLGAKWCVPGQEMLFGYEQQVWYYDGGRAYFQIADYTGDPSWLACERNILSQYRDNNVIARGGAIEGWRIFPHGIAMDYWRNGTAASLQADQLLDSGSPWVAKSGSSDVFAVRETAYAVNTMVKFQQLTGQTDWHLARAVDFLIGDIDRFAGSDPNGFQQSFYNGLALEALIQYYEMTGDARIPPTVKKMLDWLWTNGWDVNTHKLWYNPLDVPCAYSDVSNNLIAPAFAWYWNLTGDPIYLARGDEMFLHSLDEDISYSGKIFVQNYRWSFDYVRWRSGAQYSTTHPASNDPISLRLTINSLTATAIDPSDVDIGWSTVSPTSAQLEYGVGGYTTVTNIDTTLSATHKVRLSGLSPDTLYQFRIRALNAVGNVAVATGTFRTPPVSASGSGWFDTAWNYRIPLSIDHRQVSGSSPLTGFPVVVDLTLTGLMSAAYGGRVSQANGSDIVFVDSQGNRLPQQVESYDPASGHLVSWVLLPSLSPTVDTAFYVYFGNPKASAPSTSSLWDKSYAAVWHFGDGGVLSVSDSTANRNNGTIVAAGASTGILNNAAHFDYGSTQYLAFANSPSLAVSGTALTLEAWVRPLATNESEPVVNNVDSNRRGYGLVIGNGSSSITVGVSLGDGSNTVNATSAVGIPYQAWSHIAAVYSGNWVLIYINGQPVQTNITGPMINRLAASGIETDIGRAPAMPAYRLAADVDEVRISNVARSAAWIATQYNNQASSGSFIIVSPTQQNQTSTAPILISATPRTASLNPNQTQPFTATVTGSKNTSVTWATAPAVGNISPNGTYTAPSIIPTPQAITVTATSVADPSKTASSVVTLVQPVSVSLTPGAVSLNQGQTQAFTAILAGSTNTSISWSINPLLGRISATGVYTAPASIVTNQVITVAAASVADPTKIATAAISLVRPASVVLTPSAATLNPGQALTFTATVTGTTNPSVKWSITPLVGSISAAGVYTAPPTVAVNQTVTVTATSTTDSSKTATSVVTLAAAAVVTGGTLVGVGDSSKAPVNLTTEGASDWVHWGDSSLNRKAGVVAQLSTYTVIGGSPITKYGNDPRPLSWTDGAPTAIYKNCLNGVFVGGIGRGFSITAPADNTVRTIVLHAGGWNSAGTLTAHLSDGSAPDFLNTIPIAAGQYDRNYTLTYQASAPGNTLTVTWKMTSGSGNVTLAGAALKASGAGVATVRTSLVATVGNNFPRTLPVVGGMPETKVSGVAMTTLVPVGGTSDVDRSLRGRWSAVVDYWRRKNSLRTTSVSVALVLGLI